jgi:hypothetical protein
MTRILVRWIPATVGATLVAGGVLLFAPVDTSLTVRIYLLVVGALALLTLVAATAYAAGTGPSQFERALARKPARPIRPDELERLERQVALANENAFDFYSRLRPSSSSRSRRQRPRHDRRRDRSRPSPSPSG